MLSLPGPTPIHLIGTPVNSSMNWIYFLQLSGRASYEVTSSMDDCHPGRVTYSTSTLARASRSAENSNSSGKVKVRINIQNLTWKAGQLLSVYSVFDRHFNFWKFVQDVELGEVEVVISVNHAGMLQDDEVEPSTAPSAASSSAILPTDLLKMFANFLRGILATSKIRSQRRDQHLVVRLGMVHRLHEWCRP